MGVRIARRCYKNKTQKCDAELEALQKATIKMQKSQNRVASI